MVQIGQVISDKYKLLRLLGDGGMGSVYEAEHMRLGTHVAIKVLHSELARRTGIAERFVQEARVSAQIRSPHVVQVTDVESTSDGIAYLVMELLQGEPLSGVVRRQQKLPVPTAAEYTTQILQALEAAHALGVIHRDLKPDNVFVTFSGGKPVLKLIDFGIAKLKTEQTGATKNLTVAGMLMGTPEYMAPEQAYSADKVDVRADLYAVGVMLYEMLSGKPPVEASDPRVLVGKVERGEVTPLVQAAPGIEPVLAGFVHRAMAPRPELRFATATEMRVALEDILTGKRPGTAKMVIGSQHPPAQPGHVAMGATSAASPLADTANPNNPIAPVVLPENKGGTGTMMGAPIEAALSVMPTPQQMSMGPSPQQEVAPRGGTMGVPAHAPNPYAMQPPAQPVPPMPGQPAAQQYPEPQRKKGGNGLIIALAVVALLLGAGAVVTFMLGSQPSKPIVIDLPTNPPPGTTVPPTVVTTVTPPPITPPVTPLVPGPPAVGPAPKKDGGVAPAKDAGGGPASQDAGPGQTFIVTPFGTFPFPGPRPLLWPPDQPWPPPTIQPPFPAP